MEKNKVMMIVIIILLVILIVSIFGVAFAGYRIMTSNTTIEQTETTEGEADLDPSEISILNLTDPISVNLKVGEDGENHATRIEVSLGIDNTQEESEEFLAMLQSREVIIRDIIIDILSDKTYEDMMREDSKEILKDEILEELQEEFDSDLIVAVYLGSIYTD